MANPTRNETLRYEIQADGKEVVALSKDVRGLGVATQEAEQEANDLLKAFDDTSRLQKVSGLLREASAETFRYQQTLRASQASINELAVEERKLIAVENERAAALAAAKAQLDAFKTGTHGLVGTTKEIAAAQKAARDQVRSLTTALNESVRARRSVTAALSEERKAATNAAAARDKELAKARELRVELEASGQSAARLSATEKQLAAESEVLAARMRELVVQTRAAKEAATEKSVADQQSKAEAEALARAVEIQADAFKAIARAEREAAANRDNTERSVDRINDAFDAQSRKLAALRRDLLAAGASTAQLTEIERALFVRAYEAAGGLQREAEAARTAASASARLAAVKEAERQQTLRNIRAQVDQRNAQIAATEALERYRSRGKDAVATNTTLGSSFSKLRTVIATAFSALGVGALVEGGKRILTLGASAERAQVQLRGLYGSAVEANQVFTQLQRVARTQGQDFETLLKAALRFKGVGLDPLNGSLQAIIDANARAGGSAERLEGIVLALTQTYAKQRIQMEELNQLSERQIPAMQILAKVTGKQGAELLKLVESGKLGKDVIKAFIDELGKMSKGAALENLKTLGGLFDAAKNRAEAFLRQIGDSGVLDFFKDKLAKLIQRIDELEKSGDLSRWATKIADAITGVTQAIIDGTKWIYDHSRAILFLAGAYASFRIASFATQVLAATRNLIAASAAATATAAATNTAAGAAASGTTAYQLLAKAIGAIRANPVLLAIGAAATFAANNLIDLATEIDNLREANQRLADEEDGARQAKDDLIRKIQLLKQAGNDYKDTIRLTSTEVSTLTEVELFSYQQRLLRATEFYNALAREAKLAGDKAAFTEATVKLAEYNATLALVKARMGELDKAAASASKRFTDFAKSATEAFDAARTEGDSAREAVKKIFDDLDFTKTDALKTIPGVFEQIGARGRDAGVAIREGLTAALAELSGRELLKFQQNTEAAIRSGELHFQEGARILESTLLAAMIKLNVEPAKFGMGMTAAGKDAVATLKVITESVLASSEQIAAAFKSALANATTKEEAIALGEAIKRAGERGKIGLDQARDAAAAVALRLREIAIEADPLAADLEKLGVKTKAALDLARDSALRTFRAVVEGARQGKYAQEDVRAAFMKYVEAVRASTENSLGWQKSQSEAQLRTLASTNNLSDALKAMGDSGEDAGKRTADGAKQAADALDETADSANKAADSAEGLGDSANNAASGLGNMATQAEAASFSASKAFVDAAAMAGKLDRITFGLAQEEQARAEKHLADLQAQIASYDELTQRVEGLRATYKNLGDDRLREIAQAEMQLAQAQQQRLDREQQARRDRDQGKDEDQGSGSGRATASGSIQRVEVKVDLSGRTGIDPKDKAVLEELARALTPEIGRLIRRGVSLG